MTASPGRVVIGVTGHRTLADREGLPAKIDEALDKIARDAAGGELVVVSPLAEGADRLVAERVLARGGGLEAVLPMAEAAYEADFADDRSRTEFRSLLARAQTIQRLPSSSKREVAYVEAGRYVVEHCDVLIAIWDGRSANGPGGTADVVAYARSRSRPLFVIDP